MVLVKWMEELRKCLYINHDSWLVLEEDSHDWVSQNWFWLMHSEGAMDDVLREAIDATRDALHQSEGTVLPADACDALHRTLVKLCALGG